MKRHHILSVFVVMLCLKTIGAGPASHGNYVGTWSGNLEIRPGASLELVLRIEEADRGLSAYLSIPMQGATDLPASGTTMMFDGSINVQFKNLGISITGTIMPTDGPQKTIKATFKQRGMAFPLEFAPADPKGPDPKIQDPIPPFPYISTDVSFSNEREQFLLAGTVTRPSGQERFPAVVLASGSGSQDRNEEIFGHKPFLVLADALTRAGIVVLRFDDRGVGKSEGSATEATTLDIATDIASAIGFLKQQSYVDPTRIGIVGHSEGAVIAAILAAERPDVSFIILMAGTGTPGRKVLTGQTDAILRAQGVPEASIASTVAANDTIYGIILDESLSIEERKSAVSARLLRFGLGPKDRDAQIQTLFSPWYIEFLTLNPADYLERVTVPVLVLSGTKDTQVTTEPHVQAITTALSKAGNTQVTTRIYEGLNHLFQPAGTGAIDEYASIDITIEPQVLNDIAAWIGMHANLGNSPALPVEKLPHQ